MDVTPIGWVSSPRTEPLDDDWDAVTCTITLDAQQFTDEALQGLQEFSHLQVVYLFDRVDPQESSTSRTSLSGLPPRIGQPLASPA